MRINSYLFFGGDCAEAFRHYARVLGGKVTFSMTYGEAPPQEGCPPGSGDLIMHTALQAGDVLLMGSDVPRHGSPASFTPVAVSLHVDAPEAAERIFAGLSEGGSVTMAMEETFWARRFGTVTDRFGIPWMVNCPKPEA
jgi:PhnB protein